ncbi:MAG: type IV pili methyl-accepting chemotaxis transducer N-terminal domain-containing protein, partial [Planctomycetota bacterium]
MSLRSLRLSHRVLLVPVLMMLAIASIVGYTRVTLDGQSSSSVVINLAGRQRMLNQRFAKETLQEQATGGDRSHATLTLLETSAKALRDGGEVPLGGGKFADVPGIEQEAIREAFDAQEKLIATYREIAGIPAPSDDAANDAVAGEQAEKRPIDQGALEDTAKEFHRVANGAVTQLQNVSSGALTRLGSRGVALGALVIVLSILLTWRLIGEILRPVHEARRVLSLMASGQLVERADESFGRDMAALAVSLNEFQDQLARDLGGVAGTANRIDNGAGKLRAASQQLSAATTEQAATLDSITQAMESVAGLTSENAHRARKATEVAKETTREAAQG